MKTQNDSVPNGWMARLEAAQGTATQSLAGEGSEAKPVPPPPPSKPPPFKPPPLDNKKKKKEELTRKPAHLLVAQLQEDEAKRRQAEAKQLNQLFNEDNPDQISKMEIAAPKQVKKKRIPDWVVVTVLLAVVAGGIFVAYRRVQKEPPPVVKIDQKLAATAEKKKQIISALEEGHAFVEQGKPDAAIPVYEKALSLDPTFAAAARGLAIAYSKKNDDTTAVVHYRKYLELDPAAKDAEDVKKIIAAYEKKLERERKEAERKQKEAERVAKAAAKAAAERAAILAAQKKEAERIRAKQRPPKVMDEKTKELEKLTDELINE